MEIYQPLDSSLNSSVPAMQVRSTGVLIFCISSITIWPCRPTRCPLSRLIRSIFNVCKEGPLMGLLSLAGVWGGGDNLSSNGIALADKNKLNLC